MNFEFDINKSYEIPLITLCNPDFSVITDITNVTNLHIKPRFNAVSEVNFDVCQNNFYDLISKNRLIKIQGFGYFVIVSVAETNEVTSPYKSITAYSYEYTLNSKGANIKDGTYKFYDPVNPKDTLLQKFLEIAPSWEIGTVSSGLWNRYRTFEIPTNSLYSFLMEDVEKAYECIFDFDTENKLINAYTSEDIVKDTNISLSFHNLIKNVKIEETTKDIITCLSVHGSGDFTISEVNPLGTSNIYDFSYYLNENWMQKSLIDAIKKWDKKVKDSEKTYSENFSKLRDLNAELLKLQGELATLQNNLKTQEQVRSAQMPNISKSVVNKINGLNKKLSAKQKEIDSKNKEISKVQKTLQDINTSLKFANNFTKKQLLELDSFIFEASYTNSNFVVTDKMTTTEIQDMSKQLLERGKKEMKKLSQPSFTFSMELANFLFAEKFKPFIDELKLGSLIHAEVKEDVWVSPILLEIDIDYDNPENFTMTFGNKFRLETSEWTFNELFNQSKTTNSVSRNYSSLIAPIKNGGLNDQVTAYMQNSLNAANQEIISSENQDISVGSYGIKGRKKLDDGNFDNHQLMITNNLICMTDDNWQTSKLALGSINDNYGVIADTIVGKLIAGNELTITNKNNSFKLDGSGATLKNASLIIESGNSKIIQNAKDGFKIQKKENNSWKNKFYADSSGDLHLTGKINIAKNSHVGGLEITDNSIKSSNGNIVLESNGNAKIGALKIDGNNARFDGTIRADRIEGQIVNNQISHNTVTGSKLNYGTITRREIGNRAVGNTEIIRTGSAGLDSIYVTHAYIDDLYVKKTGTFAGECRWTDGGKVSTIRQSGGRLVLEANDLMEIKCPQNSGVAIKGKTAIVGATVIFGDFIVADGYNKHCMQSTKHYGKRLINAYETAECYYGDIGESEIKNGLCQIDIDPIFAECVNLETGYQVFLSPYGKGELFVLERFENCFIVCGDNMKFGWELKAKRIGFENKRLEKYKE
ncbi:MAG: hypothetical protein IJI84_06115 [Clostridia bacterium]|nr:hypothetical protein [Clostridia bacterium]